MVIYKIVNKINNKVYIGQTKNTAEERFKGHLARYRNGCGGKLYNAMRKYGIENFYIETIDSVDDKSSDCEKELNEKEIYWINYYNSTEDGYNVLIGGDVNRMYSPEAIKNHKNKMSLPETRKKISDSLKLYRKNNPFSEDHRKRLSKSAMGNHNFGNGDTRSIPVYCICEEFGKVEFHNIKLAGLWWFENYKPFGEAYSQPTFQRKILDSINGKDIKYNNRGKKYYISNIKWFKKEGDEIE